MRLNASSNLVIGSPPSGTTANDYTADKLNVIGGAQITGTLTLTKTTDASGTANNGPALIIGGAATGAHIEIDPNEIMAKSNGTTPSDLTLNNEGGPIHFGRSNNQNTDYLNVKPTTDASSTTSGALRVAGGVGIAKKLYVGDLATVKLLTITDTTKAAHINFSRVGYNYLNIPTDGALGVSFNGADGAKLTLGIEAGAVHCYADGRSDLGTATVNWKSIHSKKYVVEEKVTLQWNSTDSSLDFIFA